MLSLGHDPHPKNKFTLHIGPPLGILRREPKQRRRTRMTVALGLLAAHGGLVIAADREQTDGPMKSEQGKIMGTLVRNRGSLAVSGAGNGPYIDSLSSQIIE